MLDAGIPIETPADRRNDWAATGAGSGCLDRSPFHPWRASRDHSRVVQPLLHATSNQQRRRETIERYRSAIDAFHQYSRTRALAQRICRTIWSPRFYIRSWSRGCSAVHANWGNTKQSAEPVAIRCEEAALRRVSRGRPASRAGPHPESAKPRRTRYALGGGSIRSPRPRGEGPGTTLVGASPALRRVFHGRKNWLHSPNPMVGRESANWMARLSCRDSQVRRGRQGNWAATQAIESLRAIIEPERKLIFEWPMTGSSLICITSTSCVVPACRRIERASSICCEGPRPAISKPLAATRKHSLGILP